MKHSLFYLFFSTLLIISCQRDNHEGIQITPDPGTFNATINSVTWNPPKHKAVYNKTYHELYITASDDSYTLSMALGYDSVSMLKSYPLESNGDNDAVLRIGNDFYYSGTNMRDAGGSFVLTKLDTVQRKVSGLLQFVGYTSTRDKRVNFLSTAIEDLPLSVDTFRYDGNHADFTVIGATTTICHSKIPSARISCISDYKYKKMEVNITSALGEFSALGRYLKFQIPTYLPTGAVQILPDTPPYTYCGGNNNVTARYVIDDYNKAYYATSGTINFTSIDTTQRRLNATFTLSLKDTTSRQESIQIVNGRLTIDRWSEFK
jgi:hypothetical protein